MTTTPSLHTQAADMLERYGRVNGVMHCEVSMLIAELRAVETEIERQSAGNARYEYLRSMTAPNQTPAPTLRVLDLFSGIGGFSLGLERAGMTTVAFCEIEPYCRRVLAKHWPGVPIYEDVRELTAVRLRSDGINGIDLVCGGYPCQPFSYAGARQGADDPRHLWPSMRRIIGEVRPTWVIAENVAGHISMGLDQVLAELETDGYAGRAVVIPAAAVDAHHIRQRVWIVARNTDSNGKSTLAVDDETSGLQGDATATDSQGRAPSRKNASMGYRWPAEPGICRVVNGLPGRMDRLRSLGNAVVPQIPELIGRAIMDRT